MMRHDARVLLLACACSCVSALEIHAQVVSAYNPRDDRYKTLGLARANAEYERATGEYTRAKALSARGFLSESELASVRANFERSRVDYLQQALAILAAAPHIVINSAVKTRARDGKAHVRIALHNATESHEGADSLAGISPELLRELRVDEVKDVFVSLKSETGAAGTAISSPYERRIARLRGSAPALLDFVLLRDINEVVVSVSTGEHVDERRVLLESDLSGSAFALRPVQSSLEGTLGTQLSYDIVVERSSAGTSSAQLAVAGLSPEIQYEFRDGDSKVRLNRVRFADGQTEKRLQLVLTLPASPVDGLAEGRPAEFWALAGDSSSVAIGRGTSRDAIATTPAVARARLELLVRGVSRSELGIVNLFQEVKLRDSVQSRVSIRNEGSAPLVRARIEAESAPGWQVHFEPAQVSELAAGAAADVRMTVVPDRDATVGDYEVRMHVASASAERSNTSEEKVVRVRVVEQTPWASMVGFVGTVLVLIGGVVYSAWRVMRR